MGHIAARALIAVLAVAMLPPLTARVGRLHAQSTSAPAPPAARAATPEVRRQIQAELDHAVQRFEARDAAGVLAHVSDGYRTGPFTKAVLREQLIAMYALCDPVRARVRIDEVQIVGNHAWVYSTGDVSGRLPLVGSWTSFLSWERELEVARQEGGRWRLFGYQQ